VPTLTPADQVGLHISTLKKAQLLTYSNTGGRYPFPVASIVRQTVSDRLVLAGVQLRVGDQLIMTQSFRSAISRHYYAMYHAARAVVFAVEQGDDHEKHSTLPRNLPQSMPNAAQCEADLTDARLLRNKADYDIYPTNEADWENDARALASISAQFVSSFENFALTNGYV
jgi:uncharacterized protein (UPF0332 family)